VDFSPRARNDKFWGTEGVVHIWQKKTGLSQGVETSYDSPAYFIEMPKRWRKLSHYQITSLSH